MIKLLGDVKNPDLDEVECLVKLLTAIGALIDHAKAKAHMDEYFTRIRDMANNLGLPNRVRFMLQELIELRRGSWKVRKADPTLVKADASGGKGGGGGSRINLGGGDIRKELAAGRGGGLPGRGLPVSAGRGEGQQQQRPAEPPKTSAPGKAASGGGAASSATAVAPAPKLTQEQVEDMLGSHLEEYLSCGDVKELCTCVLEMVPRFAGAREALGKQLVTTAFGKVIDARTDDPRDKVGKMLGGLCEAKLLGRSDLKSIFTDSLEFIEDEVIDCPFAAVYYARFIAHAIIAKLLPLSFAIEATAHLVDAQLVKPKDAIGGQVGAAFMLVELLKTVADVEGKEACSKLFMAANFAEALQSRLPSEAADATGVASLLSAAGLEGLDPKLAEARRAAADEAKKAQDAQQREAKAALQAKLEGYLIEGLAPGDTGVDNESVICWVCFP